MLLVLAMALPGPAAAAQAPKATAAGLKIVVLAGEDGVNIIRQRTAVAPLVEVRDRNDLPVAGALVTFAIDTGKTAAFSAGARTLTVTTNAAGQATADGLVPLARGVVRINVKAAFQGQTASTTIVQTNAVAAASGGSAAAGAGTAAGGTAAAGATVAASSGGISATTLAIVGGAVGAGALVATQVAGKDDSGTTTTGNSSVFAGPFTGEYTFVFGPDAQGRTCARLERDTGTLRMDVAIVDNAVQSGSFARVDNAQNVVVNSACPNGPQTGQTYQWGMPDVAVTGSPSSLAFRQQIRGTAVENGVTTIVTTTFTFSGAQNGEIIVGTFTKQVRLENPLVAPVDSTTMTMPVTLTRSR